MKIIRAIALLLWLAGLAAAQPFAQRPDPLITKLASSDHRVETVAFSPDGQFIAGGYGFSIKGGVRIWRVADGSILTTLPERGSFAAGVKAVAFSDDGKLFAAATDGGEVMLWTVGSWRSFQTVLKNRGKASDLSFSPDNTKLAFSSEDAAILYDLKTAKTTVLATNSGPVDDFLGVSFSPDGKFLVVCGEQLVQVWDVETMKVARYWQPRRGGFFGRLSPDGSHVIAGGGPVFGRKAVEIWSFPDGEKQGELTEFRSGLFALSISHSGRLFAVAGGDYGASGGDLSLWSLDQTPARNPLSLNHATRLASFDKDETDLGEFRQFLYGASLNADDKAGGAHELGFVSFGKVPIQGLAFSPDDKILAAASSEGFVMLYSVELLGGPEVKERDHALCGEIEVEGDRTFIIPLVKVPVPMRDFEYAWKQEITNPDAVAGSVGAPVALAEWAIESRPDTDRARVEKFTSLASRKGAPDNSDYIVLAFVQNPGWQEGFTAKIYADGRFVAADNSGKCLSYGSLSQLNTDFVSVKDRLVREGILKVGKTPQTPGFDHYTVAFIELTVNGVAELRTDADHVGVLLSGGPATKRAAFTRIFKKEQGFIDSLLKAGKRPPRP